MVDDPITLLERELVRAAKRQAYAAEGTAAPRRGARQRPRLGGLASVGLALIPIIAVLGVVIAIRANQQAVRTSLSRRPATTLVSEIGALRTPQTRTEGQSDELPLIIRGLAAERPPLTLDRALLRDVRVTLAGPGKPHVGRSVELVVAHASGADSEQQLGVYSPPNVVTGPGRTTGEVVSEPRFVPATQFRKRGLLSLIGAETSTDTDVVIVVPDGVQSVELQVPHEQPIDSPVVDNVAGFQIPGIRYVAHPTGASMTWYGPGGKIVRQIPAASAQTGG